MGKQSVIGTLHAVLIKTMPTPVCTVSAQEPTMGVCLQDPVDAAPAVLVKRRNITKHKELEEQFAILQGDLQR